MFAFAALAIGAWAFAVPLATGPDEASQFIRAAGVVRGDVVGRHAPDGTNMWAEVSAPAGYRDVEAAGGCFIGDPRVAMFGTHQARADVDDCPRVVSDEGDEDRTTVQYRGQPFAYAVAGLPSLWFTGENGLYLMRLITTLIGAAFIASAWLSVRRLPDPRTAAVALAAALTPVALYFSGVFNPIGLEMAAALGAWTAGLALATSPAGPTGRLVTRAGLAVAALTLVRGLGPGFALIVVLACVAVADPDRRRALARRTDVRVWGAVLAGCVAVSGAWVLHVQREFPLPEYGGIGAGRAFGELPWFGRELVAVFGTTDVVPPLALHLAWTAVVLTVFVVAARRGRGRDVALAALLLVAGAALLVSGQGLGIPQTGYWWQGRYVYPLFAGGVLVVGATVGRPARGRRTAAPSPTADPPAAVPPASAVPASALHPALRAGLLGVVAVCHVWAFAFALRFHTVGYDGTLDPIDVLFHGYWTPVVGTAWLWTACLVVGVAGLAVAAWRTGPAEHPAGADPGGDPTGSGAAVPDGATPPAAPPTVALGAAR